MTSACNFSPVGIYFITVMQTVYDRARKLRPWSLYFKASKQGSFLEKLGLEKGREAGLALSKWRESK